MPNKRYHGEMAMLRGRDGDGRPIPQTLDDTPRSLWDQTEPPVSDLSVAAFIMVTTVLILIVVGILLIGAFS